MTQKETGETVLLYNQIFQTSTKRDKLQKIDNLFVDIRSLWVKFYTIKFSQTVLQEMHEDK